MKNILLIVFSRFKIFLRKPVFIFICLFLPVVFYLLLGQVFREGEGYDRIPVALVDEDNTESSREIIRNLQNNEALRCLVLSRQDAVKNLQNNKIEGIYIFKKGLEDKIQREELSGLVEVHYPPKSLAAAGLTDVVASEMMPLICAVRSSGTLENINKLIGNSEKRITKEEFFNNYQKLLETSEFNLPLDIKNVFPGSNEKSSPTRPPSIMESSLPGIIVLFTTLYLFFNAGVFIKERRSGVKGRLKAGGFTPLQIVSGDVMGIVITGLIISLIQSLLLFPAFSAGLSYSLLLALLVNLVYIVCISTILVFITRIMKSTTAFQSLLPVFVFFFGLLGGCIFSIELFPRGLLWLSKCLPTYWGQNALSRVLLYGGGIGDVNINLIILLATSIVLYIGSVLLEKRDCK